MPGEICVIEEVLSRSGVSRSELRPDRFSPHLFRPGSRWYRTGQLGRWTPHGTLEFVGWTEDQSPECLALKLALESRPGIAATVVLTAQIPGAKPQLSAYVARAPWAGVQYPHAYRLPNGRSVLHQSKEIADIMFREIFTANTYLRHGLEIPEDGCVFDVGANIGVFSVYASERCPQGRIHAFEPMAPTFQCLRSNTALASSRIKTHQCGLGSMDTTVEFTFYPGAPNASTMSRYVDPKRDIDIVKARMRDALPSWAPHRSEIDQVLDEVLNEPDKSPESASRTVVERLRAKIGDDVHFPRMTALLTMALPVNLSPQLAILRRLSSVIRDEQIDRIDLLKIDVERSELDVLAGIDPADWGKIQQVVMEVHSQAVLDKVSALLLVHGFQIITEENELFSTFGTYNLYARKQAAVRCHPAGKRTMVTPSDPCSESELSKHLNSCAAAAAAPTRYIVLP